METASRDQLLEQLLSGYESLSLEAKMLHEQRRELENKLSWAKQQHQEILKRFAPEVATDEHQTFLFSLEEAGSCQQDGQTDWLDALMQGDAPDCRTRAYNIRLASDAYAKLRASPMEQDFTTPGTPSRLGCPFVPPSGRKLGSHAASIYERHSLTTPRSSVSRASLSKGRGRGSRRPSVPDPIQAEMCGMDPVHSTEAPSIEGSAGVCPIRFLDQHSPEEVAQYFENHKHEIPRSHEVCVKRYQSNAESIRQLDAKYGNLVSMIQGLGIKHQTYLPPDPDAAPDDEANEEHGDSSNTKVQHWAERVSESLNGNTPDEEETEETKEEDRLPHFDRPLRDVRVGESPSRPWGISVPTRYEDTHDNDSQSVDKEEHPSPKPTTEPARPVGKCPFDHTKLVGNPPVPPHPVAAAHDEPLRPPSERPATVETVPAETQSKPQMIFTGPVFIGYPMEQAMELLRQSKAAGLV